MVKTMNDIYVTSNLYVQELREPLEDVNLLLTGIFFNHLHKHIDYLILDKNSGIENWYRYKFEVWSDNIPNSEEVLNSYFELNKGNKVQNWEKFIKLQTI